MKDIDENGLMILLFMWIVLMVIAIGNIFFAIAKLILSFFI